MNPGLIDSYSALPGPALRELLRMLPGLRNNPLQFLLDTANRYGDLAQFKIGNRYAFVLTGPEEIQYVLQENNRNYTKDTIQYNSLARVTGRGLLTSDGDLWLRQRRRMQPAFHRQKIASFGPLMAAAAASRMDAWAALPGGNALDVDREMMELALEILGRALLGVDLRREAPALTSAVLVALDHIVLGLKSPSLLPGWVPTPRQRRFELAMRALDSAVQDIIRAHRARSGGEGSSLLDVMLRSTDDGEGMSDQQLRDELITILIAGHETVASALTWACYLLAQNPTAEARLRQELRQALGEGDNLRPPSVDDLPALDYTRRVFDETLRLYPPAWLVTRKNVQDDTIRGARIPAGSLVVISIAGVQRSPACWNNPQQFDPDRFLPENSAGRHRYAYLPFGGGPRLCIGNTFALQEAPLVLAAIYQRYHLELVDPEAMIVDALVTQRPRGGLHMRVRPADG